MESTARLYSALKLFNNISYSQDYLVRYRKMMENVSVFVNSSNRLAIDRSFDVVVASHRQLIPSN